MGWEVLQRHQAFSSETETKITITRCLIEGLG